MKKKELIERLRELQRNLEQEAKEAWLNAENQDVSDVVVGQHVSAAEVNEKIADSLRKLLDEAVSYPSESDRSW